MSVQELQYTDRDRWWGRRRMLFKLILLNHGDGVGPGARVAALRSSRSTTSALDVEGGANGDGESSETRESEVPEAALKEAEAAAAVPAASNEDPESDPEEVKEVANIVEKDGEGPPPVGPAAASGPAEGAAAAGPPTQGLSTSPSVAGVNADPAAVSPEEGPKGPPPPLR